MNSKPATSTRPTRPKPGERRLQILQTLATMLQEPGTDRVTTAALAARLQVSEAALYRHFASKAQMFEGLIDFIESTIFGLINQITTQHADGVRQMSNICHMLLGFAEKNPGMSRVLVGDAIVVEDDRLQNRINQLVERLETTFRQCLRDAIAQGRIAPDADVNARASLVLACVQGKWLRFVKGGFKHVPTQGFEAQFPLLMS